MSPDDLPEWVWRIVAAVDEYEDQHGHPNDGWPCLRAAIEGVPAEVRTAARLAKRWSAVPGRSEP